MQSWILPAGSGQPSAGKRFQDNGSGRSSRFWFAGDKQPVKQIQKPGQNQQNNDQGTEGTHSKEDAKLRQQLIGGHVP